MSAISFAMAAPVFIAIPASASDSAGAVSYTHLYPLSDKIVETKKQRDKEIADVFTGKSNKFLLIIGPCSADKEEPVLDYISRLVPVQEQVKDCLLYTSRCV